MRLPLFSSSIASLAIFYRLSWHLLSSLLASSNASFGIFYCLSFCLPLPLLTSIDTSLEYMGAVSPLLPNAGCRSFQYLDNVLLFHLSFLLSVLSTNIIVHILLSSQCIRFNSSSYPDYKSLIPKSYLPLFLSSVFQCTCARLLFSVKSKYLLLQFFSLCHLHQRSVFSTFLFI